MYAKQDFQIIPDSTHSINLWNVAAALHIPKGMQVNSYSPRCMMNADLARDSLSMLICQYPEARSSEEKNFIPPSVSKMSSILGRIHVLPGYAVKSAVVDAKSILVILLGYQDNGTGPGSGPLSTLELSPQ